MSVPRSLNRAEAAERSVLLDVAGYHVEVDLTALPVGPEVRCTSTARFASRREGAETFVDCCAQVVSATLNGQPLPACDEGRIALGPLAADNVLIVETIQTDSSSGRGVHKAVDPADGEVYVWTSFEPDEARFVWACFDQPDLKARYALTVLAPSGWSVVSNSGDPEVGAVGDEVQRWVFPPTPPLPTYLVRVKISLASRSNSGRSDRRANTPRS